MNEKFIRQYILAAETPGLMLLSEAARKNELTEGCVRLAHFTFLDGGLPLMFISITSTVQLVNLTTKNSA
jgi:hypothetical protein